MRVILFFSFVIIILAIAVNPSCWIGEAVAGIIVMAMYYSVATYVARVDNGKREIERKISKMESEMGDVIRTNVLIINENRMLWDGVLSLIVQMKEENIVPIWMPTSAHYDE